MVSLYRNVGALQVLSVCHMLIVNHVSAVITHYVLFEFRKIRLISH